MKKNRDLKKTKSAVGGLVGRSVGGRIENCHFEGEITIRGNPEGLDVGGLVGQQEETKIVNSSADAKIKFADEMHPAELIFEFKPGIYGFNINLRALFRKVRTFFRAGN